MLYLSVFDTTIGMVGAFFQFVTAVATVGIWLKAGNISDKIKLLTHQRNLDEKVELSMEIMMLIFTIQQYENEINALVNEGAQKNKIDRQAKLLHSKQNELKKNSKNGRQFVTKQIKYTMIVDVHHFLPSL